VYFVYILYCPVTELSYVGQTDNLILRYYRHRDGKSRWTSRMRDPIVVHWEAFDKLRVQFRDGRLVVGDVPRCALEFLPHPFVGLSVGSPHTNVDACVPPFFEHEVRSKIALKDFDSNDASVAPRQHLDGRHE
jgi:hypothetical protein